MEHKTKQFEAQEAWAKLLRPRKAFPEPRMICKFKRVTSKLLGPINEWAKRDLNSGGDVSHYGFVVDTSEVVWVFPYRSKTQDRLCLVFDLDGSVKSQKVLGYTDEEIEKGYRLI